MKRIADNLDFAKLPEEPAARHEQFLECFGQDLLGFRNDALRQIYEQLDRAPAENLLPFDRDFFHRAATHLSPEHRELSRTLTERTITLFMERLMTMLGSDASNWPLGQEHGIRYRLLAQVHHCPREKPTKKYRQPPEPANLEPDDFEPADPPPSQTEPDPRTPLEQHDLSAGGNLQFPKYWHRWMNRYAR